MGSTGKSRIGGGEPLETRGETTSSSGESKVFDTKATGSHTYEDRGIKDTSRWFDQNSNNQELYSEIAGDSEIAGAFRTWASGHFMAGQQYGEFSDMIVRDQRLTRIYDSILDRSVIRKAFEVHRSATPELLLGKGVTRLDGDALMAMVGKTVITRGNMSTGAASEGLTIGRDYAKTIDYVYKFPDNTTGAGLYIGTPKVNPSWKGEQREFMTNRDLSFDVTNVRRLTERERADYRARTGETAPYFQAVLEYKGRLDHNYS